MSHPLEERPAPADSDAAVRHAGNTPYRLLDAWRGVAALWVVLLHVRLPDTPAPLARIGAGGHLGVPMFFVISGYCIANAAVRAGDAPQPVRHFLRARIRRIYPPYFLAVLVAAVRLLALPALIRHHVLGSGQPADLDLLGQGWRFYLGTLTLTQVPLHAALITRVLWSLCYEVAFYAVVSAFLLLAARAKPAPRLLDALSLLTVLTLLWQSIAASPLPFPWDLWPQFGLGVLVYQVLAQPHRRSPQLVFALCGGLIAVYAVRYRTEALMDGMTTGLVALFTLGFAATLLLLFRWDGRLAGLRPVRLLSGVGLFSYSLYLIHLLALGFVTHGLNRLHGLDAHPWLLYALRFAVCVLAGRLFFHVCERPFLDTRQRQAVREARETAPSVPVIPTLP